MSDLLSPAAPLRIGSDRARSQAAYGLAGCVFAAALLSVVPAVWDVSDYFRRPDGLDSRGVARWALAALLLAVVQVAYAIYLFQLPDWTTVWVVTLLLLAIAGLYA